MTLVHTSHLVGVSNVLTISSCTLSRTVEDCGIKKPRSDKLEGYIQGSDRKYELLNC